MQDGFIHLTKEAPLLLGVANHFYKDIKDEFLVLVIDSRKLTSKVGEDPIFFVMHQHSIQDAIFDAVNLLGCSPHPYL